ncbi:MAG: glycosyltransferase [Gimesia sp.]|nr:glycosyltransferase [Gimesia sp.]
MIPRKSKIKNIVVLTTYFNPTKNGNQEKNFRTFMARLGSPVIVVELSFDGNFLSDHSIQLKGDVQKHLLWQKESMLNIAIENLPDDVDAVVWIDSDLIFENPNWLEETKLQLETYDLVQMYDCVNYIRADGQIEKSIPSFGKCSVDGNKEEGSPGGAWAARRELLVDGLYDKRITGGGDSEQLRRWISQKLSIGYTSGTLQHLYHGDYSDRQIHSRYEILKRHRFDPAKDICKDEQGLWAWNSDKTDLHREVKEYFEKRNRAVDPVPQLVMNQTTKIKPACKANQIPKVRSPVVPQKHRESYACDVILPYSKENYKYLKDSIKSVLNQNFVKTTIHLVNDGMKYDPIGYEFSLLDNVRFYKNTDGPVGPYVTYNRLFDHLEHDCFANQDSDDLSLPMRLYKSLKLIAEGYDIVGGSMEQFVSYDDESERMRRALTWKPYHHSGAVYAASPSGTIVNSTMVMRKSVYEVANGMAPWIAGADSEFYERCILAGYKAVAMQDVVSLRRLHNLSLSNDQVTSGHGSGLREQIKQMTEESIKSQRVASDHSIGGLAKHRSDQELVFLNPRN